MDKITRWTVLRNGRLAPDDHPRDAPGEELVLTDAQTRSLGDPEAEWSVVEWVGERPGDWDVATDTIARFRRGVEIWRRTTTT